MSSEATSKADWPVYTMPYRALGVERQLRLEWHHEPEEFGDVEEVVQCLRGYVNNPQDVTDIPNGDTFKTLLPDCCIVMKSGHITESSSTDRPPDPYYHITVRFGKLADRARPRGGSGYSVHIYLNKDTKNYNPGFKNRWGTPKRDIAKHSAVYKDRSQWPPGANSTEAPFAPGLQNQVSTPSTQGLTPAPLPTTNAWGVSQGASLWSNPPQSGQGPAQGPSSGAPPLGGGRGVPPSDRGRGVPPSDRGRGAR